MNKQGCGKMGGEMEWGGGIWEGVKGVAEEVVENEVERREECRELGREKGRM